MILAREFGISVFRASGKDFDEILDHHGKEAEIEENTLKIGDKSWKLERFS